MTLSPQRPAGSDHGNVVGRSRHPFSAFGMAAPSNLLEGWRLMDQGSPCESSVSTFSPAGKTLRPVPAHSSDDSHPLRIAKGGLSLSFVPRRLATTASHTVSRNMVGPLLSGAGENLGEGQKGFPVVSYKENEQPDRATIASAGWGFLSGWLSFTLRGTFCLGVAPARGLGVSLSFSFFWTVSLCESFNSP
jgi:hypothetical protein